MVRYNIYGILDKINEQLININGHDEEELDENKKIDKMENIEDIVKKEKKEKKEE